MKFSPIRTLFFIAAVGIAATPGLAAPIDKAIEQADERLQQAVEQHSKIIDDITKERSPMETRIEELDEKQAELSKEYKLLEREKIARSRDQVVLMKEIQARKAELDYAEQVLKDFAREFPVRLQGYERQYYGAEIQEITEASKASNLTPSERVAARLLMMKLSLERVKDITGGNVRDGKALLNGQQYDGKIAMFGPRGYFASDDGNVAGPLVPNDAEVPSVLPLDEASVAPIKSFVAGERAAIPIDPNGKAYQVEAGKDSIREHVAQGGYVGYCILGLGAFCMLIAAFKAIEIIAFKVPRRREVLAILEELRSGNQKAAGGIVDRMKGAGKELMRVGVDHYEEKREMIEELFYEKILGVRPKVERFLPFLAVTAAAAPLMGLLGTVMGMIKTFKLITVLGTGDPRNLTVGDLLEALVTTELGLVVAIPTLIIHGVLVRMARGKLGSMEASAVAFLNGVYGMDEAHEEAAAPRPQLPLHRSWR
ncbi:MAG: MotA/TolQ/ExbB proton channel family protein [Verrucomicrobiales bacterium]